MWRGILEGMRVVVIGGTGHIGSALTPQLVKAGFDVTCVSRGLKTPYWDDAAWAKVKQVTLDRPAEEAAGTFGESVARLDGEVVIDLTCYTPESSALLVAALQGRVAHLLHCGTVWIHGHSVEVPTSEDAVREPFGEYGIRKAEIERDLLTAAREDGLPVTLLHPGHLVGAGWNPVNPQGNFNPGVFSAMLRGEEIALPNIGMETVHHVHVEDVAQAFVKAVQRREQAIGESFHVVSGAALTLRGFAEKIFAHFGQTARMRFLPYEEWKALVSEKDARSTWDHIAHSPNCSVAKARERLGYAPRYRSIEAVVESVEWLRGAGIV